MNVEKEKIERKLKKIGATLPCHRCGNTSFTILNDISPMSLGILVKVLYCDNCGAVTFHHTQVLDELI